MELRAGLDIEMLGEDKRKSRGEREKEVGSRDELKHLVPG